MESDVPLTIKGIKTALAQTPYVYAHANGTSYQINSVKNIADVLYVRRTADYQWIIPEQVVQGLPSPPLTQEQSLALTLAQAAIETIERVVPQERESRSQQRQQCLLRAYDTLSRQSSPLGIGIQPFHDYDLVKLLSIAAQFKRQIEQRYAHRI